MANAVKIVYTSFARASSGLDTQPLPPGKSAADALTIACFRLCMETPSATIYLDDGTTVKEIWHNPKSKAVKVKPGSVPRAKAIRNAPKEPPATETQPSTETPAEQSTEPATVKVKRGIDAVFYYTGGGSKTVHYESTASARSEAKHTLRSTQAFVRVVIGGKSISRVSLLALASSYDPERAASESYWSRIHQENSASAK